MASELGDRLFDAEKVLEPLLRHFIYSNYEGKKWHGIWEWDVDEIIEYLGQHGEDTSYSFGWEVHSKKPLLDYWAECVYPEIADEKQQLVPREVSECVFKSKVTRLKSPVFISHSAYLKTLTDESNMHVRLLNDSNTDVEKIVQKYLNRNTIDNKKELYEFVSAAATAVLYNKCPPLELRDMLKDKVYMNPVIVSPMLKYHALKDMMDHPIDEWTDLRDGFTDQLNKYTEVISNMTPQRFMLSNSFPPSPFGCTPDEAYRYFCCRYRAPLEEEYASEAEELATVINSLDIDLNLSDWNDILEWVVSVNEMTEEVSDLIFEEDDIDG